MDLKIDVALQQKLASAARAVALAQQEYREVRRELDAHIRSALLTVQVGRDAMVEHVHSAAHHGNVSEKLVLSRVLNGFGDVISGSEPTLRIQLGKASGTGLGDQYAFLAVSDVLRIVAPSLKPFPEAA